MGSFPCWNGATNLTTILYHQIVSEHNYHIAMNNHRSSEAGRVVDALWQARSEALEARETEEERKRAERKAKREASRKAKQTATTREEVAR